MTFNIKLKILKILFLEDSLYLNFFKMFLNFYIFIFFKLVKDFKKYRMYYHYYNDVLYTRYPFLISFFIFMLVTMFLNYLLTLNISYLILGSIFFSLVLAESIRGWAREMLIEAFYMGKYNRKIQRCIHIGTLLFVLSEVMVFAGFFWVYFDRCFHKPLYFSVETISIERLVVYKRPLIATLTLLLASLYMTTGYYFYSCGSFIPVYIWNFLCISSGSIFLLIQIFEYMHFIMHYYDSVFASCFYLLTGFHGFHVLVGLILLSIQTERLIDIQFNPAQNSGYNMAMIYWNFVDIVWCILFVVLYIY